jgi:hypothetical protein
MESIAVIGEAVGAELFAATAHQVLQMLLQEAQQGTAYAPDDPCGKYMVQVQ